MFWMRMIQLFPHKFITAEGDYKDYHGNYTGNFLRWCDELKGFTDKHWERAYNKIEDNIKTGAKTGNDAWPPVSVAVVGLAESVINSKMYRELPNVELEDLTAKEKRKEVGLSELAKLKGLFDE